METESNFHLEEEGEPGIEMPECDPGLATEVPLLIQESGSAICCGPAVPSRPGIIAKGVGQKPSVSQRGQD